MRFPGFPPLHRRRRRGAARGRLRDPDGCRNQHQSLELKRMVVQAKGHGFGRAALRVVKKMAFDDLGAHRFWLDVKARNSRAKALYDSEGFVDEGAAARGREGRGRLRLAGRDVDAAAGIHGRAAASGWSCTHETARPGRTGSPGASLALLLAAPAQAEVWGYVDAKGVAHFRHREDGRALRAVLPRRRELRHVARRQGRAGVETPRAVAVPTAPANSSRSSTSRPATSRSSTTCAKPRKPRTSTTNC